MGIKQLFKNAGKIPLWEVNVLNNAGNVNNSGASSPKIINISPVGIKKYLKHLVMLIALGLGAPKLLTFPLWESKKVLKIGDVLPCGK